MNTIKEIIDEVSIIELERQNSKYWIYLGNFLDYFYLKSTSNEERLRLMEEEPVSYTTVSDYLYSLTAASMHQLCLNYKLEVPKWVLSRKYVLKEPKFAMDAKGDLRLILLMESPRAYKMRNLFVTKNVLSRV